MHTNRHNQTVAIIGASGFLGSHLVKRLLNQTTYHVRAISRLPYDYNVAASQAVRFQAITASVMDEEATIIALQDVDVAFYFVHLMGQTNDFYDQESIAAQRFAAACMASGVSRVVFMGGLGDDQEELSRHLLSRHNTGTVLREILPLVIELRASIILANGSIAYDIIRKLAAVMPIMPLPRWSMSLTQPIALSDALEYLVGAIELECSKHEIVEIGGQEILSYQDLYTTYAHSIGRHPLIVRLPFLPEWLSGWWLGLFTGRYHARIGRIMVHSLSNAMIVKHPADARRLFPDIHPKTLTEALREAAQI
jgi:uncharacterized protein YbjT (DUF2867 family)